MKYININKLADEQYEDLSDFIDNRLLKTTSNVSNTRENTK